MTLSVGTRLGPYEIVGPLGSGGMGEVYRAHDSKLNRDVALKILPELFAHDPDRLARFKREAQVLASLNHPNIAAIYGLEEADGIRALVLELVEGPTLAGRIVKGPIPIDETLPIARQIAEALDAAHEKGIVHRDLKPTNIKIAPNGMVKVLDFGLAKVGGDDGSAQDLSQSPTVTVEATREGVILGTVAYMSPEQARGKPVDKRTDIWSFGCVLYEMLTGRLAFAGETVSDTIAAILDRDPDWSALPAATPAGIHRLLQRCFDKNVIERLADISEAHARIDQVFAHATVPARARRVGAKRLGVGAMAAIIALAAGPVYRWQRERALQAGLVEIERLVDVGRYAAAYRIARDLERRAPADARVRRAVGNLTFPMNVRTDPPGAELFFKDYGDATDPWQQLGMSPIEHGRVPGQVQWKITKPGFDPIEGRFVWGTTHVRMSPTGASPPDMVLVPGGATEFTTSPWSEMPDYWIDKYEVTNREFKTFVDRGGYQDRRYWKHPFVRDGQTFSWEQAVMAFRDKTGRFGPATWELGTYAMGQAYYPVSGVSWYEAAAFAEFAAKSLPTVMHWQKAAGPPNLREDAEHANFSGKGLQSVSALQDLGPYGTYGLAGNVKEWCWNPVEGQRYILGGSWNEPVYMGGVPDARPPFDRSEMNGVRLVKYSTPPDAALLGELRLLPQQLALHKPVGDDVFDVYRSFYSYDHRPLGATIERTEDTELWRMQKISFAAGYGNERVPIYLFLPKNAPPPYQTVIWYPGSYDLDLPSSDQLSFQVYWDFLPQSGRAFVYPVYQGFLERRLVKTGQPQGSAWRDMMIQQSKDLGRTIEYLETRTEIDNTKIGYFGFSMGADDAIPLLAMESRLKALVLLSAGLNSMGVPLPGEIDPVNFVSRIKAPLLLLGGRYDFITPTTQQAELFKLFGTSDTDKRHVIYDGGHVPPRIDMIRTILDFLDERLGPVKK